MKWRDWHYSDYIFIHEHHNNNTICGDHILKIEPMVKIILQSFVCSICSFEWKYYKVNAAFNWKAQNWLL